ncbi:unnamed protein product [Caenorhabditis sp. 36 PRJEB53466]|nr:unnamed protein product [Caenorhabditis sp. 36 PRJEB53466]
MRLLVLFLALLGLFSALRHESESSSNCDDYDDDWDCDHVDEDDYDDDSLHPVPRRGFGPPVKRPKERSEYIRFGKK